MLAWKANGTILEAGSEHETAMLIKKADGQDKKLAELEKRANSGGPDARWAQVELRNRRAGVRGEQQAAHLIDFSYANSNNWCVIHDLRIQSKGRTAQIDHLLINRFLDMYVLESKHFHAGVKITDEGDFLRWNNFEKRYEGMPSPIEQNARHIEVLRDLLGEIELPTRMGIRIMPSLESYILISENSRIIRPEKFDTSRVVKPGQLKSKIWKKIDSMNLFVGTAKLIGKTVAPKTMEDLARRLVELHKPIGVESRGIEQDSGRESFMDRIREKVRQVEERVGFSRGQDVNSQGQKIPALYCRECSGINGRVLYGKFGYYFRCSRCSKNTAIRFSCLPGHSPRLRKQGKYFYRDCPQCGSSNLYYQNR